MHYIYIDEAWRGPLAWPVYVGIVLVAIAKNKIREWKDIDALPGMDNKAYSIYDDSKIIAETKREELYERLIRDKHIKRSSWSVSAKEIDKHGIVWGIRTSIARALWRYFGEWTFSLKKFQAWIDHHADKFVFVVDGKTDFHMRKLWWVTVMPIVDGDAKVPMIGAASIVAKVERDREMRKHHKKFVHYGFEKHKWYGTKSHYEAIRFHGMSKLHRKTFLKNIANNDVEAE